MHIPMPKLNREEIDRFWSRVNRGHPNACWDWTASLANGYGQIKFQGSNYYANRIAFFLHNKKDPGVLKVCHTCDRPCCCSPAHLWLGTPLDNNRDCIEKGRRAKGSQFPQAKLTDNQVRDIRKQHAKGVKQCDLVLQYNIHKATISRIIHRKLWKHV